MESTDKECSDDKIKLIEKDMNDLKDRVVTFESDLRLKDETINNLRNCLDILNKEVKSLKEKDNLVDFETKENEREKEAPEEDTSDKIIGVCRDNSLNNDPVNTFVCGLCEEASNNIPSLRSHMKNHEKIPQIDGNEDNSYQDFSVILPDGFGRFIPGVWYPCEKCDFRTTSKDDLMKHDIKKHKVNQSSRRKKKHI